jgi:uncharacterized protein YjbJ (UPF0337 family)
MSDTQRLDRIEASLEKLTGAVNTLAGAVIGRDDQIEAHDRQIGALIELAAKHEKALANLEKQWTAYLSTIHPKQ